MLYILFSILSSVVLANMLVLYTKDKTINIILIFLGNYIVASLFSFSMSLPGGISFDRFDIWFGIFTGLVFLGNFVAFQKNISINGLSLSVGTMRVSVIIPTLVAVFLFADKIGLINVIGIGVIISAFAYVTDAKTLRNTYWLVLLFLISGITESTLKVYTEIGKSSLSTFLMIVYFAAGSFALLWILVKKKPFQLKSLLYGFALGIPNQLSSLLFLKGLQIVPATLAYPFCASGIVILSILSDMLIWKRLFTVKQRIALALLVIGIVLVSLR
jgi:drug/metabolite transporter (DMT)-like permease